MNKSVNHLFICSCGDIDHQFVIQIPPDNWYENNEPKELWLHIHLRRDLNWLQKLKYIFLYILGKQSKYGAFGEIILKKDDIVRLRSICDEFIQSEEKRL